MTTPTIGCMRALARLARYLAGATWLQYCFSWQDEVAARRLAIFSDSDYAGCLRTRRSTSGGLAFRGKHLVKHWSSTQKCVTLSSAEAELSSMVKSASEGLGLRSLAPDLGMPSYLELHGDSSAGIGICRRAGIGRVRHLAVGQLWLQEHVKDGLISLYKVRGNHNPADMLTKHVPGTTLQELLKLVPVQFAKHRAQSAPTVAAA